jgi:hypothetical protein
LDEAEEYDEEDELEMEDFLEPSNQTQRGREYAESGVDDTSEEVDEADAFEGVKLILQIHVA